MKPTTTTTAQAHAYRNRLFPGYDSPFATTDPEFHERYDNFAFGEVPASDDLDDKTRLMAVLAALIGCQGLATFQAMTKGAFNAGVTPVEVKEIVYQAVPYMGLGRVLPFIHATNELLEHRLVTLPLEGQATTTIDERLEAGRQKQIDIFGPEMADFAESGPEETRHINRWLVENCFGDYYTRTGLGDARREMVTFCFLLAQGGCESQVLSHAQGNMRVGNDKAFLIKVVSQCIPYIGYPRCLNAIQSVKQAAAAMEIAAE